MAIATRRQPRIPLEELCRLPSFFLPVVSWKGDQVAFYWDKTGRLELHVLDLRTKHVRQVSHGETPRALRTGFTWTRDDLAMDIPVIEVDVNGKQKKIKLRDVVDRDAAVAWSVDQFKRRGIVESRGAN